MLLQCDFELSKLPVKLIILEIKLNIILAHITCQSEQQMDNSEHKSLFIDEAERHTVTNTL